MNFTLDKIKQIIGSDLYNHITSLNLEQTERQLKAIKDELKLESVKTERGWRLLTEMELLIRHSR